MRVLVHRPLVDDVCSFAPRSVWKLLLVARNFFDASCCIGSFYLIFVSYTVCSFISSFLFVVHSTISDNIKTDCLQASKHCMKKCMKECPGLGEDLTCLLLHESSKTSAATSAFASASTTNANDADLDPRPSDEDPKAFTSDAADDSILLGAQASAAPASPTGNTLWGMLVNLPFEERNEMARMLLASSCSESRHAATRKGSTNLTTGTSTCYRSPSAGIYTATAGVGVGGGGGVTSSILNAFHRSAEIGRNAMIASTLAKCRKVKHEINQAKEGARNHNEEKVGMEERKADTAKELKDKFDSLAYHQNEVEVLQREIDGLQETHTEQVSLIRTRELQVAVFAQTEKEKKENLKQLEKRLAVLETKVGVCKFSMEELAFANGHESFYKLVESRRDHDYSE